jgi:ribA/ribD-fused uncharacterized protein
MTHPIESINTLLTAIDAGFQPKYLFFWGHQPSKNGQITKSCFSQWWEGHAFEVEGVLYKTAEHYMMAEKARLFGDEASRTQILAANHPSEAKELGRKVTNFVDDIWVTQRFDIVTQANLAKFGQHADLKQFLLNTGERVLVEASPHDRIWGIGLKDNDPKAPHPAEWRGLNLLGFALMTVRARLGKA